MYEPGTTMIVNRLLKPGMVAVDVGAHVGYYTRLFARLVGEHGKVYAFEPTPKTFIILEHNTRIFPNVNRFNMAVLDREAVVELYESINSGANSLWPNNTRGTPTGSVLVKAMPLDKVLSDMCPHLVKLDVEGAELEVLRGMHNLLSRSINLALIVEWNPSCLVGRGVDPGLLTDTIGGLGFEVSAIDEVTGRVEPANLDSGVEYLLDRGVKYINLLCTRR
jgi:FkbM family methyltransferase